MSSQHGELADSTVLAGGQTLEIIKGDITLQDTDAIVNAANARLSHGGGVAWHIARKGGRVIQEESAAWVQKHGLVTHDLPAVTRAGQLPCKYVIHAVGPIWGEGYEDRKLEAAIRGCFSQASALALTSLAIPAISTGIFGFPKDRAALIFMRTIQTLYQSHPDISIQCVRIVLIDEPTLSAFLDAFKAVFPHEDAP